MGFRSKGLFWRPLAGLLGATLLLAGCGAAGPAASANGTAPCASNASGKPVVFGANEFQSVDVDTKVAEFIVQNGYCQPTKTENISTAAVQQEIVSGGVDVWMEVWQQNIYSWWQKELSAGKIVNLDAIYQSSAQGFFIPSYTAKQYPKLTSVSQLSQYWQVFKDPQKPTTGLFINCIPSWNCSQVNLVKLNAYGIAKYFTVEQPGSATALQATIYGMYQKKQNFVTYYWEPTALLGLIHLVRLKEPAYTTACDTLEQKLISNNAISQATSAAGCGYENSPVDKGGNAAWAKADPAVATFLQKMQMGTQPLEQVLAYQNNSKTSNTKAAEWYLGHYASTWESWVPANVASRVKAALVADGVKVG